MVEYPGIEPGVRKRGGFTIHCITVDASTPLMNLQVVPPLTIGTIRAFESRAPGYQGYVAGEILGCY
jgi:hypothetical protein